MRFVGALLSWLVLVLAPARAAANIMLFDDAPPPPPSPFAVGFRVMESFPSVSYSQAASREFGSPSQHVLSSAIDAVVSYRVLPWLRTEAALGAAEMSLAWNMDCAPGAMCLASLGQAAVVIGAGAQAFYRRDHWEVYGDATVHAPIPIEDANTAFFFGDGGFDGKLTGGESVMLAVGGARRIDTARFFVELGYEHSIVALHASGVGISASFGGVMIGGGISVW